MGRGEIAHAYRLVKLDGGSMCGEGLYEVCMVIVLSISILNKRGSSKFTGSTALRSVHSLATTTG